MFNVILNVVIIIMWSWIGFMTVNSKIRKTHQTNDEDAKRQHKGELVQYALVYIMMMMLLVERTLEAIMSL